MKTGDEGVAASLETKLDTFVAGLTSDEVVLFGLLVEGAEVSGFDAKSEAAAQKRAQMFDMLSSILKKYSETQAGIVQNIR